MCRQLRYLLVVSGTIRCDSFGSYALQDILHSLSLQWAVQSQRMLSRPGVHPFLFFILLLKKSFWNGNLCSGETSPIHSYDSTASLVVLTSVWILCAFFFCQAFTGSAWMVDVGFVDGYTQHQGTKYTNISTSKVLSRIHNHTRQMLMDRFTSYLLLGSWS